MIILIKLKKLKSVICATKLLTVKSLTKTVNFVIAMIYYHPCTIQGMVEAQKNYARLKEIYQMLKEKKGSHILKNYYNVDERFFRKPCSGCGGIPTPMIPKT